MNNSKPKYYSLQEFLEMIPEPNYNAVMKLYTDYKHIIDIAKGSTIKHQAWNCGYKDHLEEIMNLAVSLYEIYRIRSSDFSLSDAILVLFLHDLEKPFKYSGNESEKSELYSYDDYQDFILAKASQYKIILSDTHINALKYIHGEGNDYQKDTRIQLPLAAFVHICDTWSARIWFDQPKIHGEW